MKPHQFTTRVYYEDTDAGGVVYYANYLKFAERARTEWLRSRGFEQEAMRQEKGLAIVVRHCSADYLAPARLDDQLVIETRLHEMGKVLMTMQQVILRGAKPLVELTVRLACINSSGKPVRWPKDLTDAFVKP